MGSRSGIGNLPVRLSSTVLANIYVPYLPIVTAFAGLGGQGWEIGWVLDAKTYPDGESRTEASDLSEFRRFFDLRIKDSAIRTM